MNALTVDVLDDQAVIMDGETTVALMLGQAKVGFKNGLALVRAFNARRVKWLKDEIATTREATRASREVIRHV